MLFEVLRTTTQQGTFKADSPVEALALAKEKFERPFYDRRAVFTVREVEDSPRGVAVEAEAPDQRRIR